MQNAALIARAERETPNIDGKGHNVHDGISITPDESLSCDNINYKKQ
jgi:hypothetical protein